MTISEAAAELYESRWSTLRKCQNGQLPAIKLAGRTGAWIILRADIEAHKSATVAEMRERIAMMEQAAS